MEQSPMRPAHVQGTPYHDPSHTTYPCHLPVLAEVTPPDCSARTVKGGASLSLSFEADKV